jgi:Ca2+-binding EF-hand superfamily protein
LLPLDTNADEMISAGELSPGLNTEGVPTLGGTPAHGLLSDGLPFYAFQPDGPAGDLANKLLERYDRNRDGKLSREEFGLPSPAFARLDRDGDGKLDSVELARYPELAPDLEFVLNVAPGAFEMKVSPGADPVLRVRCPVGGGAVVDLPDIRLEVAGARGSMRSRPAFRESALARFRALDRNGDGVLDKGEIYQPPFEFVSLLRLADRDGDGKVTREEFESFVRLREKIQLACTYWRLLDSGRSLFGLLDEDQDGRLSQRELQGAQASLAPRGESLTRENLPRLFRLTVSYGEPLLNGPPTRPAPRGPLWFRKMDRNGDGDVSRAEWLGSEEDFRKIDADGDGLISLEEAEKADARSRRK